MRILSLIILVLTSFVYVPTTDAARLINHDWCDLMYSELHFQEVPPTIHAECKSRFQWNINREKASMREYARRLNTFNY